MQKDCLPEPHLRLCLAWHCQSGVGVIMVDSRIKQSSSTKGQYVTSLMK